MMPVLETELFPSETGLLIDIISRAGFVQRLARNKNCDWRSAPVRPPQRDSAGERA